MTINQTTLLLDQNTWDLTLDTSGSIALANAPYSIAQDVATATLTQIGECWYDQSIGLPYWQSIFKDSPPLSFVRAKMYQAAMRINNVQKTEIAFNQISNRNLTGQIQIVDTDGNVQSIGFNQ